MNVAQFEAWISNLRIGRTILKIQQHHTYIPSYIHFTGSNHFERQLAMKNYYVNQNGWQDIGQHFTIFPDGAILTGRSLEQSLACIRRCAWYWLLHFHENSNIVHVITKQTRRGKFFLIKDRIRKVDIYPI